MTISNLQTVKDQKVIELGQLEPQISVVLLSNPESTATIEEVRSQIKNGLTDFTTKVSQPEQASEAMAVLYDRVFE